MVPIELAGGNDLADHDLRDLRRLQGASGARSCNCAVAQTPRNTAEGSLARRLAKIENKLKHVES